MKFVYTQNPTAKKPIILVDKYIGTDANGVTGIDGGIMAREILALENAGVQEVEMWVNSKGGQWSEGVSIVGAMTNSSINFTTVNMGFADSTAGHIFQAGHKRVWNDYAVGLVHEIQGSATSDVIEALNASVATMLCRKSNKTAPEVREMMAASTMMDCEMAEKYGFCDEVRKGNDILRFTNSSDHNDIINYGATQIKKSLPKIHKMEAVNAALGLTNEASESAQLNAIKALIDAKNAADTKVTELTGQLTTTNSLLTETTNKLNAAEATILEATNAAKRTAAENLIKENAGKKIVNDEATVKLWTEKAIADYDGTKALLDSLNVNATAPKFEPNGDGSATPVTAASFMAQKQKEVAETRRK